ncbi:hypothetical protein DITRI_Ditri11bG0023700 [Diplodiscus trichospermus]
MRAASTTATINIWKSPIPFLLGSLAIVLLMILVSLVMLVVVIMAGNDTPKYLAAPVTSSVCRCGQV